MARGPAQLPPGFVLDEEAPAAPAAANLPDGFVLEDEPAAAPPSTFRAPRNVPVPPVRPRDLPTPDVAAQSLEIDPGTLTPGGGAAVGAVVGDRGRLTFGQQGNDAVQRMRGADAPVQVPLTDPAQDAAESTFGLPASMRKKILESQQQAAAEMEANRKIEGSKAPTAPPENLNWPRHIAEAVPRSMADMGVDVLGGIGRGVIGATDIPQVVKEHQKAQQQIAAAELKPGEVRPDTKGVPTPDLGMPALAVQPGVGEQGKPESREGYKAKRDLWDKAIESAKDWNKEKFNPDPAKREEFAGKLIEGAASTLPFIAGGAVARGLGLSAEWAAGVMGAAQTGQSMYDEAIKFNASPGGAYTAFLLGLGVGASEALPIAHLFDRMESMVPGSVTNIFKQAAINGVKQSGEEALQEAFQQFGQNGIAKLIYDKDRALLDGVLENATIGGIVGGMMGLGTGLAGTRKGREQIVKRAEEMADEARTAASGPAPSGPSVDGPGATPSPAAPEAASPTPTPEPQRDTAAQIAAVRDPKSGKDTALITPDSAQDVDTNGLEVIDTPKGRFVTNNPYKAAFIREKKDKLDEQQIADILGYGGTKADSDGTVIQAQDAAGNVVHEEATSQGAKADATARAEAAMPEGGQIVETDALGTQVRRAEEIAKETAQSNTADQPQAVENTNGAENISKDTSAPQSPNAANEDAALREAGWSDEDIAIMGAREREANLRDAEDQGIKVATGTRGAPVKVESPAQLEGVRAQIAEPTDGQKEAGNYRKGHVQFDGLNISIETGKGQDRKGKNPDGTDWSHTMPADYGYVKRSEGADGENVDVLIGDKPANGKVFLIDQHDAQTGKFDEHKAVVGVDSVAEAQKLYRDSFGDGRGADRIGAMREMTTAEFKAWLKEGPQTAPAVQDDGSVAPPEGFERPTAGEAPAPPPRRGKAGRPQSLIGFLRSAGGIRPHGELDGRDFDKRYPGLIRNSGLTLDHAREIAAESGYLGNDPENDTSTTTISDLIDALEGPTRYSSLDTQGVANMEAERDRKAKPQEDRREAERILFNGLEEAGMSSADFVGDALDRAVEIMVTEGVEWDHAIELAVMRGLDEGERAALDGDKDVGQIPWESIDAGEATGRLPWNEAGADEQASAGATDVDGPSLVAAWNAGDRDGAQGQDNVGRAQSADAGEAQGDVGESESGEEADQGEHPEISRYDQQIADAHEVLKRLDGETDRSYFLRVMHWYYVDHKMGGAFDVVRKALSPMVERETFKITMPNGSKVRKPEIQIAETPAGWTSAISFMLPGMGEAASADMWPTLRTSDERYDDNGYLPDRKTAMQVGFDRLRSRLSKGEGSKPRDLAVIDAWGKEQGLTVPDAAAKPAKAPAAPAAEKWTQIGVNRDGNPVYEDANGVRSYTESGVRVSEPVAIIPGGGASIDSANRSPDFLPVEQQAEAPAAPKPNVKIIEEMPLPLQFFQAFAGGMAFDTITQARKFARENGHGNLDEKQIDEAIEQGIVMTARNIIESNIGDPAKTYDALVSLYARQPNLSTRTSTSIAQQAYSTPAPLAYVASQLAGITEKSSVFEPSAGNGMLTIGADVGRTVVNELNGDRHAWLEGQGYKAALNDDASNLMLVREAYGANGNEGFDAVIANPPFGAVKDADGQSKRFIMADIQPGYTTAEIDHAISLRALEAMADGGRGVLIIGGINKLAKTQEARSDAYNGKAKREFFKTLYDHYNVVDHFTVAGELYTRQGAGWPVDVIVIAGRGKSERKLPAADVPPIYSSWDEIKEKVNGTAVTISRPSGGSAGPRLNVVEPAAGGTAAGNVEPVAASVTGGVPEQPGTRGSEPVRGGRDEQPASPVAQLPAGDRLAERATRGEPGGSSATSDAEPRKRVEKPPAPAANRETQETEHQVSYTPRAQSGALGTLVPTNMKTAVDNALVALEKRVGPIAEYIQNKLEISPQHAQEAFAAEQMDALALAIDNIERGAMFIIGDQTGIGKGRVNAGLIAYAIKKGHIPIFFTEKPNLYADIYRDLKDIKIERIIGHEPRMVMTNSQGAVPLGGGRELKPLPPKKLKDMLNEAATGGALPGYDLMVTTYNQIQTVKGEDTLRRRAIEGLAPRAIILMDEAHNAGGTEAGDRASGQGAQNRADYSRTILQKAVGAFASSATFAKRPSVMSLYARTDLGKAVSSIDALTDIMTRGGVPMQQVVSAMLAESGQYVRRERSFSGVEYNPTVVEVDVAAYEQVARSLAAVNRLSRVVKAITKQISKELKEDAKAAGMSEAVGDTGAQSTNFTSVMHNIINQMLLSFKAPIAAARAIEAIKNGEKPVITVANTMQSFIDDTAADLGVAHGEVMDISFQGLLERYLEKTRTITIKRPFMARGETAEKVRLTDAQLGEAGMAALRAAHEAISEINVANLPISPIDYIRAMISRAGYRLGEITGRTSMLTYGADNTLTYEPRLQHEVSIKGRKENIDKFNDGQIDAILLNRAGSTGLSLHASKDFKDQRRRRMILAQPEENIDTHMQMLGRIHRTGQVVTPAYDQLIANIPAEMRPAAILAKKMASLNASTTASRSSALTSSDTPDFMNEYGDLVAFQTMNENPELLNTLGHDVLGEEPTGTMRKVTGRIPLLTPVSEQTKLYDILTENYASLVAQMEEEGNSILEAKRLDLDARNINTSVLAQASGDTPFTGPVIAETVSTKRLTPPYNAENLIADLRKSIGVEQGELTLPIAQILGRQKAVQMAADLKDDVRLFRQSRADDLESDKAIEKAQKKVDDDWEHWQAVSKVVHIGAYVSIDTGERIFSGIVTDVFKATETQNPVALGSWQYVVAVAGEGKKRVGFNHTTLAPLMDEQANLYRATTRQGDLAKLAAHYDEMAKGSRDTRIILTGNLVKAFDMARKGSIINYTDDQGGMRQGILMPGSVKKVSDILKDKGVLLSDPSAIKEALLAAEDQQMKGTVVTLGYQRSNNTLRIYTPASKSGGGDVYLNESVLAALRQNGGFQFSKKGAQMEAFVSFNRSEPVIQALLNIGESFMRKRTAAELASMDAGFTPDDGGPPKGPGGGVALSALVRADNSPGTSYIDSLPRDQARQMIQAVHRVINETAGNVISGSQVARRIFTSDQEGLANTGMFDSLGGEDVEVGGVYRMADKLIMVSLNQLDPFSTAYHEAFHALEFAGVITAQESAVLRAERQRLEEWLRATNPKMEALGLMPQFEINAYAFSAYERAIRYKDMRGMGMLTQPVLRILGKLVAFFRRIRNAINGLGFITSSDVFARALSGEMNQRTPDPRQAEAAQMGAMFSAIQTAPARPRMFGRESFVDRLRRKAFVTKTGYIDRQQEKYVDYSLPMKRMQESLMSIGVEIAPSRDAYGAKRLASGRASTRKKDAKRRYVEPLQEFLIEKGLTRQDLSEYLFARHAPERNAAMDDIDPGNNGRGSGITNDEAATIMADFERRGVTADLQEAAAMADQIREATLEMLLDGGLITEATANAWREKYQHYVPLRGWDDPSLAPDDAFDGEGRKLSIYGAETKQAYGRSTIADDPLANLIVQMDRAIDRAERNRALQSLWRLMRSLDADTLKEIATTDRGPMVKAIDEATGMMVWKPDPGWRFDENTVALKIGGIPHAIYFHDLGLAQAIKRTASEPLQDILKPIATYRQLWRSMIIKYNPAFVFRHFFVRNQFEGSMNVYKDRGIGPALKLFKSYPFGTVSRAVIAAEKMNDSQRLAVLRKVGDGKGSKRERYQAYYFEMRAAGGVVDFSQYGKIEDIKRRIDAVVGYEGQTTTRHIVEAARAFDELIERVTSGWDNAQRLMNYIDLRENGKTRHEAAIEARDTTVDFELRGKWSSHLNTIWHPFWNTAIQGVNRQKRGFASRKGAILATVLFGVGFMSAMLNYWFGGEDDDGKYFYDKIPDYVRRMNIPFLLPIYDEKGRPYEVRIMMPYGIYSFISGLGASTAQMLMHAFGNGRTETPGKILQNTIKSALDTVAPPASEGTALGKVLPWFAVPFYHVASNTKWTGTPLHPTNRPGIAASEQAFRNTSAFWKTVAVSINKATGGDRYTSGVLDFNPESYKEVFGFGTDVMERMITQVGGSIDNVQDGQPAITKMPFAKELIGGGPAFDAADRSGYYEHRNKVYALAAQIKAARKDNATGTLNELMRKNPGALAAESVFRGADQFRNGRMKQIEQIEKNESLTAAQKRQQVQKIEKEILQLQNTARKRATALVKPD